MEEKIDFEKEVDYDTVIKKCIEKEKKHLETRKDVRLFYWMNKRENPGLNNLTDDEYFNYMRKLKSFHFKLNSEMLTLDEKDKDFLQKRDKRLMTVKASSFLGMFSFLWLLRKMITFKKIYFRNIIINSFIYGFLGLTFANKCTERYNIKHYEKDMYHLVLNYG